MTYRCYADELPDPLVNPPKQTTRGVKSKPTSRPQSVMSRASSRIPAASSLGVRKDDVRAQSVIPPLLPPRFIFHLCSCRHHHVRQVIR